MKCLGLRAQTVDTACFIYNIYATSFYGSFEINFKLKNLKKVEQKLSLGGGIATVGAQYWHAGEIGFESQPGYYNNPV